MTPHLIAWLIGAAFLALAAAQPATASDAMDRKLGALIAAESALPIGADPGPALRETFAAQFGGLTNSDLELLSNYDLRIYQRASRTLAFYTHDSQFLRRAERAFVKLEQRNVVTQHDFSSLFRAYVQFRDFDRAAALALRHIGMEHEALPEFTGLDDALTGPTVLTLRKDGVISRVPAGLARSGPQVVVASHPLCHFSENAVRAIAQDADLAAMFHGRTLWLMPQDGALNLEAVSEWNIQFPDYEMRWAYRTGDWPMIKRWATPNFYFYRDGELVDTVIGWPPEGQRDALIAAFAKIGIAPPEGVQPSR